MAKLFSSYKATSCQLDEHFLHMKHLWSVPSLFARDAKADADWSVISAKGQIEGVAPVEANSWLQKFANGSLLIVC